MHCHNNANGTTEFVNSANRIMVRFMEFIRTRFRLGFTTIQSNILIIINHQRFLLPNSEFIKTNDTFL